MGQINPFTGIPPVGTSPPNLRGGRRAIDQNLPAAPEDDDMLVENNGEASVIDGDSSNSDQQPQDGSNQRPPSDHAADEPAHIDLTA